MAEKLARKALYDLVWSEPMKTLSSRFGISDVALKKTCQRAGIPTPDRGYWAKRDAGREPFQAAFPLRPPGMDDDVEFGGGGNASYRRSDNEEFLKPIGPPPEFPEPIETVRARIAEVVGRVTVPKKVLTWHTCIDRLLKEDEKRREKLLTDAHIMSWDRPIFESALERRRLRILNSLFLAVAKMNGRSSLRGREAREITISFFQQHLHLSLDRPKRSNRRNTLSNTNDGSDETRLCMSILKGWGSEDLVVSWQDTETQRLEMLLTDIAIHVILTAENNYRERALHQHQWRIQWKAKLEEEERQRRLAAERAETERLKRIEQGRINRLMRDAAAFQQAGEIRRYVATMRRTLADNASSTIDEVERWSQWALAQADRIDPAIGGKFSKAMEDEDEK